jgi:formylglycine-generating enzyme required for sulfatase activity/tRNA A-37 threonylcarbamoyl transferase component Bud32
MIDLSNRQLGQYQLIEVIRRGGMSTVYKAQQPSLDRYVAVKVMTHDRDPQFAARFKREARAIAQLQHHNILPVYDYGEQDTLLFLVLQYIENGVTLGDMLGAPMEPGAALRLMARVLEALDYAHQRGIVHRDIKPANVLMPSPTWPMLADFGIAKLMNDNQQRLTVPGLIVGTAAYMAPEQATGQPIDARTDIYASGVMLYEMLTGHVPFDAETPMAVLTKHVYEPPPPPSSLVPDLPASVEAVVLRAIAKDPAARFQSATEMAAELERVAARLEQDRARGQLTGLYQAGVAAFESGHWEEAVERFGKLVEIDPSYEDAPDLLDAARAAQDRVRTEARQQLELVRQRRSTMHQQVRSRTDTTPAATASTAGGAGAGTRPTTRLSLEEVAAASAAQSATGPTTSGGHATATPSPARRYLPLAIGGVVVLALLAFLISRFVLGGPTPNPPPTGEPGVAGLTAAPATTPDATNSAGPTAAQRPTAGSVPSPAATVGHQPNSGVAAPDPAGTLVFEDDFQNDAIEQAKSGLKNQIRNATDFERGFHPPGVYHFKVLGTNVTYSVVLPRFLYRDFAMQFDQWDNSDDISAGDVAQGMVFRVRDGEHYYAVMLNSRKRQYTVRKVDGHDNQSELIPWKTSPLIKADKEVNLLRVDAVGDGFKIYMNGMLLDEFSDTSYPSGMVGMIVSNIDAPTPHMHFDNMKIWSNDSPPAAPGLEPQRADPNGDMVLVPGGEFILGGNESDDAASQIYALPNFYIDRTEVTNAAYARCVAAGKCSALADGASATHPSYATDPQYANYPVINVKWAQANDFCGWAGKRLPTEAEWEKAAGWDATARTKTIWPFGNEFDPAKLNSAESKSLDTTPVGQFDAELNKTVDMAGNVSEWTSSLAKPYPYDEADGREDLTAGGDRVYRGGSWAQTQGKALNVFRIGTAPDYAGREIGFRCAVTP